MCPPVTTWTRWGLTADKLQTVLMKSTELIHLRGVNLEMRRKYFASFYFGETWASITEGCIIWTLLGNTRQAALPTDGVFCGVILPLANTGQSDSTDGSRNTWTKVVGAQGWSLSLDVFRRVSGYHSQTRSVRLWFLRRKSSPWFSITIWSL